MRCLGGPQDVLIGHLAPEGDVVADRVVEQHHFLAHHGDLLAQAPELVVAHITAIDPYAARADVVEARQQVDQCRLAAARAPDDRQAFPGSHLQRHIGERRGSPGRLRSAALPDRIAERDVLELHRTADARGAERAALRLGQLIEHFEQALSCSDPLLQRACDPDQVAQRLRDADQRGDEAQHVAHAHAPMDRIRDRDPQHDRGAHGGHLLHHRVGDASCQDQLHVGAQVVSVYRIELAGEMRFRVVHLDESCRLETLLGNTRDVAHGILDAAAVAAELEVDDRDQPADQGGEYERDEREANVEPQHEADRAEDGERRAYYQVDRVGGRLADLLTVVSETREQHRRGAAVEVSDRQLQDVAEYVAPQPADDLPPDVAHVVGLDEFADATQQEQSHQRDGNPHDGARVLMHQRAVAEFLGEPRKARHGRGEQRATEHAEYEGAAVGSQVAEQPAVSRTRTRGGQGPHAPSPARRSACVVQGLLAGSSLTVAILTSTKPRRPSTSMAVMTDWWVARASARTVTRMARLPPASLRIAARRVSGLELISSRWFTR